MTNKIRRAFSQAAFQYEILTSLHEEIGAELLKKIIDIEKADVVIDVGMGTGRLTRRVSFYFPESLIIGMDFAEGMLRVAKQKRDNGYKQHAIVQADAAALPFRQACADVIVSNLAYQWVGDLPAAFQQVYDTLTPGGQFTATIFGRRTFEELFRALETTHTRQERLPIERLASQQDIEAALRKAGFTEVKTDFEFIRVQFPDMLTLVRWIKNIGANALPKDIYIGKEHLARAKAYYQKHFPDRFGVFTTFEVIWVKAK